MQNQAVTVLASAVIIDRSQLPTDAQALQESMSSAYGTGLPVMFVENANLFFSPKSLVAFLESGDDNWKLVVEKYNLSITSDDLRIIQRAVEIRKEILAKLKPTWEFQRVPTGWSIETHIVIGKTRVGRKVGEGYYIGLKVFEVLWKAYAAWINDNENQNYSYVQASGYQKRADFTSTDLRVGCQTIHRYEIEQFALHQGWAFPS